MNRDEPDLADLLDQLRPLEGTQLVAGNWTIGGRGVDGVLEWFSPDGEPRPELLRAIVAACLAAPTLVRRLRDLEAKPIVCPCGCEQFSCCRCVV